MMTAGIAATRPIAVASSASAMPGATTARLVVCAFEIPIKLFMMPHTVPNNPTKGEVAPMVASNPMPRRIRRASARRISAKLDAARSLIPVSDEIPADSRASRMAAARNDHSTPRLAPSANWASASERESPILSSAVLSLRRATASSIILAMKMVQVTSEAKARPIITALTRTSADRNIDHGDRSPTAAAVDFNNLLSLELAVSLEAAGAAADGAVAPSAAGAACAGLAGGCNDCAAGAGCVTGAGACDAGATVPCWAIAAEADATTVNATSNLRIVLNIATFVPGLFGDRMCG